MFTSSNFKMMFDFTIKMALQPPHLHLLTSPECSTLGKLFLKVEKSYPNR